MNRKSILPSIRDLRDALAQEKKKIYTTDTRHVRVRVYDDRWEVDGGTGQFIENGVAEDGMLAIVHQTMDRHTSSYELAKKIVPVLRAQLPVDATDRPAKNGPDQTSAAP